MGVEYKSNKTKDQKSIEMKNIIETLENGVRDVFYSDKYKNYLNFCGKFHNYSFNNVLLILSQYPKAQMCASYATWKSLKMPIKKGEKGIKILCPIPYKYKKKPNDGEEELEELTGIRYRIGHVFDISQVEGEIPEIAKEIELNPEYLRSIIYELIDNSSIPVFFDTSLKKNYANGYYDPTVDRIALRQDMSTLQTLKTLIHETAHSIMHNKDCVNYSRRECEVQAESTAYVVCATLGLDTCEYSFGYIAAWSSGKELNELKNALSIIEKTSKDILNWITVSTDLKLSA